MQLPGDIGDPAARRKWRRRSVTGWVLALSLLATAPGQTGADPSAGAAPAQIGAELARRIRDAGLDEQACYRVRDLNFAKEDLRFYLTEGYLIFGKPVNGRRLSAVFTADVEAGDAELIVFPPTRSERLSLASFTRTPNLDEHFVAAIFVFSDNTGDHLLRQAAGQRLQPEAAPLLRSVWEPVVRNLAESFEIRLVRDLLSEGAEANGLFFAGITGRSLGNFDVIYDAAARQQVAVGQVAYRDNRSYFDMWTSFPARSYRTGRIQPPEERAIRLSDIRIEAELLPNLRVRAVTRMKVTAARGAGRAIDFELSPRVRVTELRIDGVPAEPFMRDSLRANLLRHTENDLFLAIAPKPLDPGRTYEFEFHHEGDVVTASGNGVFYVGSRATWYPNRRAEFDRYELTFRYPKTLDLVSTGEVVEDRTDGEWRITKRRTSSPIRMAGFNLGDYDKATVSRGGYTVEVYANRKLESALQPHPRAVLVVPPPAWPRGGRRPQEMLAVPMPEPPPNPTARLRVLANEIASALEFMSTYFGPPPLKTLTVSPIPGTFGQGFPGLLYLSTLSYLRPGDRPAALRGEAYRVFFSEILHAHEVGHQWWGNLVTSSNYQDDWLMEALANYSALLQLEKRRGRRALDAVLDEYRKHLLRKNEDGLALESAGPIIWGTRLRSSRFPDAWRIILYEKGSWILHMLRGRLGDARFLQMLGEVAKRYRYRVLTTEEFRRAALEFIPPKSQDAKLEDFFDQWVYATGVPTLKLSCSISGKAGAWKVRGTLTQSGVDEAFTTLVPVEAQLPGKRAVTEWIQSSSEPVRFTLTLKQRPLRVALDPAGTVLAKID